MIDIFNVNTPNNNIKIYYASGVNSFQTWQKPANAKFVHFFVLGGGGGGGGGAFGPGGTSRRGGGSGGSSAHVTSLFPARQLPDTLYINVGLGGAGGIGLSASTAGGAGALSYVMLYPSTAFTATNVILQSGGAGAGGGINGSGTGAGGAAGTIWTIATNLFNNMRFAYPYVGYVGALGQTLSASLPVLISGVTTAGGAGAGMNGATPQNGGNIIGGGNVPTISGGTSNTTLTVDGSSGYMGTVPNSLGLTNKQMIFIGGSGGASSNLDRGGDGGNAAYGSGGGGGGAGFTNLAGNGGRGGNGLVIITTW